MERNGSDLDSGMHHDRFENRCVDKVAAGSSATLSGVFVLRIYNRFNLDDLSSILPQNLDLFCSGRLCYRKQAGAASVEDCQG